MKKLFPLLLLLLMLFPLTAFAAKPDEKADEKNPDLPSYAVFVTEDAKYPVEPDAEPEEIPELKAPYTGEIRIDVFDGYGNRLDADACIWSVDELQGIHVDDTGADTTLLTLEEDAIEEYFKLRCVFCFKEEKYEFVLPCCNLTAAESSKDEGSGPPQDQFLTYLTASHNGCGIIDIWIPSLEEDPVPATIQLFAMDQNHNHIPNVTYRMWYDLPGKMPNGVSLVNHSGEYFDLEISSKAINGTYNITMVAVDANGNSITGTFKLQLKKQIDHLEITEPNLSVAFPSSIVMPSGNDTLSYKLKITAFDQDGKEMPCTDYDLLANSTGIPVVAFLGCTASHFTGVTVHKLGNGYFEIILDSSAQSMLGLLDDSVVLLLTYLGGDRGPSGTSFSHATQHITLCRPVLTRANISYLPIKVPGGGNTTHSKITVHGYNQTGSAMGGLIFSLSGLPDGVTVVSESNGVFSLDIADNAIPGSYPITATVSCDGTTVNATTLWKLLPADPYLYDARLVFEEGKYVISKADGGILPTTAQVIAYDQYGCVYNTPLSLTLMTQGYTISARNTNARGYSRDGLYDVKIDQSASLGQGICVYGKVTDGSHTVSVKAVLNVY